METKIPLKMHVVRLVNDENQTVNTTLYMRLARIQTQTHMHRMRERRVRTHHQPWTKDCILIRLTMIVMQIVKLRFNIYFNFCCNRRSQAKPCSVLFCSQLFHRFACFQSVCFILIRLKRSAVCYQY